MRRKFCHCRVVCVVCLPCVCSPCVCLLCVCLPCPRLCLQAHAAVYRTADVMLEGKHKVDALVQDFKDVKARPDTDTADR